MEKPGERFKMEVCFSFRYNLSTENTCAQKLPVTLQKV